MTQYNVNTKDGRKTSVATYRTVKDKRELYVSSFSETGKTHLPRRKNETYHPEQKYTLQNNGAGKR